MSKKLRVTNIKLIIKERDGNKFKYSFLIKAEKSLFSSRYYYCFLDSDKENLSPQEIVTKALDTIDKKEFYEFDEYSGPGSFLVQHRNIDTPLGTLSATPFTNDDLRTFGNEKDWPHLPYESK